MPWFYHYLDYDLTVKNKKKIIGLLGGIASGKTQVAKIFSQLNCAIIDADKIAHQAFNDEQIKQEIIGLFGEKVINSNQKVDKKHIASKVFNNNTMLAKLNSIIHPFVLDRIEDMIVDYSAETDYKAIVLDVPLLMEVGWQSRCDILIFIDCDIEKRMHFADNRAGLTGKQLNNRENCQISLDKKRQIAHYIIHNNSDLKSLKKQVEEISTKIFG